MESALLYKIQPVKPESHYFEVECLIPIPDPNGQIFSLPNWIPGSYKIRDFSRHLVYIKAFSQYQPITITQLDKSTWQCAKTDHPLQLQYRVFAWDLSPRGAYLDTTRAFFNGSRVFFQIHGQEETFCQIELLPPLGERYLAWKVGTSMKSLSAYKYQFGTYCAENYAELIDHPVEMGEFRTLSFEAYGIPHEILLTGRHFGDLERLCTDIQKICKYHLSFFGLPYPFSRYVFLVTLLADAYGGLEHRSSTAIHCSFNALPKADDLEMSNQYLSLLGLFSHEYFHSWIVKKIMPAAFSSYDLSTENYTRQLWIFEGITSYYDDLALLRSGCISKEAYLVLLSNTLNRFLSNVGRQYQTLETASFEAWTKFYQPDENALNATVSYYVKGAIVALLLDLKIRTHSKGKFSLDDVMRRCWERYQANQAGLEEGEFECLVSEVTQLDLVNFFNIALRSTKELPIEDILTDFGLKMGSTHISLVSNNISRSAPSLGIQCRKDKEEIYVESVMENGSAFIAGLAPGDCIIAIDNLKVTRPILDDFLLNYKVGDTLTVHVFRRESLMTFSIILKEKLDKNYSVTFAPNVHGKQDHLLEKWISG